MGIAMKSREGYTRVPASWGKGMPEELRAQFACSLCPDSEDCTGSKQCDAGTGLVWVPDHIYMVWRLHADPNAVTHREWAVDRHHAKETP